MPRRPHIHLDGIPLRICSVGHNREPCVNVENKSSLAPLIPQGRISQVATQPRSGTPVTVLAGNFAYGYPFAGPQSFQYGNGLSFNQSRDQDYRPATAVDGPYQKTYSHDPAGNVASLTDIGNALLSFTYDSTGRLTGATDTAAGSFGILGWTYDQNGNRQSETRNAGTLPYVYSPPGSNWLYQKGTDTRPRTASGNTASSTAIGSFTYDGFNRLATSQTASETTTYTYNALGERMKKINQNGLSTVFHYGPDGELLYEQDANGNTKVYVWLEGRPLARIDNDAQIYYYHVDHLGTPQAMTNSTGTTVWKADYEPFGKATVRVNTIENNLRLPGQYYDRETGLHYNYFRDYDSDGGRYIQADPIGIAGGLNIYEYGRSNPLTYIDPLGLYGLPWEAPPNFNPLAPKSGPTAPRGSLGASATIGSTTVSRSTNSDGVVWGQTTQISVGASVDICFNTPPPQACSAIPSVPRAPDFYSYGVGKNLGLTVNSDSSFCINVGPSFGLPGGIGWNLTPRGK